MKTVFVSGCYDILHAGHIQFFQDARALGDRLVVCFASREVLALHKTRHSSLPDTHKRFLLESLRMVDEVVMGTGTKIGFDFEEHFRRIKPDVLAVTDDSSFQNEKKQLCEELGAEFEVLAKQPPEFDPISTSEIVSSIRAPVFLPLRVDFAGGWLDVPRFAVDGAYVVNCAISPLVSIDRWHYKKRSGLGGSAAWAMLNGKNGVESEIDQGVGWQDPAVIRETGCCVWRSGENPQLDFKRNGDFLKGCLGLLWTGIEHDTPGLSDRERDYGLIVESGALAREGVINSDLDQIGAGMQAFYQMQLAEGMEPLERYDESIAWKYCGGGHGGYALYIFLGPICRDGWVSEDPERRMVIEPFTM